MVRTTSALLVAAVLASTCVSSARAFSLAQDVSFVRDQVSRRGGLGAGHDHHTSEVDDVPVDRLEYWYDGQLLDHLNGGENGETWSQRYFMNDTFFDKNKQLVFLCVGGEGPALQPTVVVTGGEHCAWMINLAEKFGALIVAAEHRFYGKSMPKPDYSVDSLQYLSSQQAQGDLKRLRSFVTNTTDGLESYAKWITFGGSYPGMMAAWARMLNPDLFHASVSSSAPVQAELNMQGYNDVVAYSLTDQSVGGSLSCLKNVKLAFMHLGDVLTGESQSDMEQLAKTYNVCNVSQIFEERNQKMFLEGFWGLFPLQSNDPSCEGDYCNYQKICDLFDKQDDPRQSLLTLFQSLGPQAPQCYDISWSEMIKSMQDIHSQDRSWIWQTCTEFGFYQTCDPNTYCPFTSFPHASDLDSYLDICKQAYGIEGYDVANAVIESNQFYSGWNCNATNVFFVNGGVDPWHAASVLFPNNKEQKTLMVKGASHHAWTHPLTGHDQESVTEARKDIEEIVANWVVGPATKEDVERRMRRGGRRLGRRRTRGGGLGGGTGIVV
ncbi:serine carboxypeptidase S28 [Chloropicon primus]|uniref:Serine carboxypeptidase S28 n=1 Tax=Chloropicon primus TaxID=1764295 RepID=A0A5B8MST5_9CHLO|nr:hypothetical protein A3770_11p63560 [Chloropicon primus]UPR03051.1 serine carboxypeptidase S28 [Chloropicon primus]|eukprot:QDZ23838.1 hypothetical protein A3770_11p63560 [Chloropicon primus]